MADLPFAEFLPPPEDPGPGWSPFAAGESRAAVFRRDDGAAFAKCVDSDGIDDLRGERDRVRWLATVGIPGPGVLGWSSSERGACLLTTAVPGIPASDLPSAELLRAWPSIVLMLRRLHDVPVAECPFDRTLGSMIRIADDVVHRDAVNPDFLVEEQRGAPATESLAAVRSELDARIAQEADDLVVCHGDACLPNVMVDPEGLACTGFVDLGRLGAADRHADLSLLVASARETWTGDDEKHAWTVLGQSYGADPVAPDRLRFYLHLDPLTWS